MSRRYASRRYAGGLGSSRIRTRIPTTRQLGQWVSLRKTLRFRVRLQLSQSRCLSLLLAMSGRVFLFLPPRGHEPPPTLRDRLNPNLSLYRHSFPIPRYAKRIISWRSPPLYYCTLTLISMQGHQNHNPFYLRVLDYSVVIWSYMILEKLILVYR